MMRTIAFALLAFVVFLGASVPAEAGRGKKNNQMVKGTIKSIDVKAGVLVVNQKLRASTVERQLDIREATEFVLISGKEKKELSGKDGLAEIADQVGASVSVKCDKDVNVLRVTVRMKKK